MKLKPYTLLSIISTAAILSACSSSLKVIDTNINAKKHGTSYVYRIDPETGKKNRVYWVDQVTGKSGGYIVPRTETQRLITERIIHQ